MSMFRIAMNDGWTEVMYQTMDQVYLFGTLVLYLTVLFFIFFHLITNSVIGRMTWDVFLFRICMSMSLIILFLLT